MGKPTLVGQALGAGTIAFDDLTINEYDAAGTFTREVAHILPTTASGWYFWSANNVGTGSTGSGCKTSATCLTITGTTDDASFGGYGFYFVPTQGYRYSISGWMKGTDLPAGAAARIRLDLLGSSTPVRVRDKHGLRDMMAPYLAWSAAHDVPLYLGEFGVYKACFANGKGGSAGCGGRLQSRDRRRRVRRPDRRGAVVPPVPRGRLRALLRHRPRRYRTTRNRPLIDQLTARLHAAP